MQYLTSSLSIKLSNTQITIFTLKSLQSLILCFTFHQKLHTEVPSISDLVFYLPPLAQPTVIAPPVSNSDHKSIFFFLPLKPGIPSPSSPHRVWLYERADFCLANDHMNTIQWEPILPSSDTQASRIILKELLIHIMHKTIPSELVYPSPHATPPWISRSLLSLIKTRKALFSSARSKVSTKNWAAYYSCRNRTRSPSMFFKMPFLSQQLIFLFKPLQHFLSV